MNRFGVDEEDEELGFEQKADDDSNSSAPSSPGVFSEDASASDDETLAGALDVDEKEEEKDNLGKIK